MGQRVQFYSKVKGHLKEDAHAVTSRWRHTTSQTIRADHSGDSQSDLERNPSLIPITTSQHIND